MRHNADVTTSESGGLSPRLGIGVPRGAAPRSHPCSCWFPVSPRELSFLQTLRDQGSAEYGLVALL